MTLAYWHQEYSTGNTLVDQQHQHLFEIVNTLHDAMMQGQGRTLIKQTLDELIKYTIDHFATEEQLMKDNNYPDYIIHKRKHDELTDKVTSLAEEFAERNILINAEVLHFLNEWLIHHIKGEDQKMINFMRNKNNLPVYHYSKTEYNKETIAKIEQSQALIKQLRNSINSKHKS